MSDALIVFQENDPLKASTTNDNNTFLLNQITQAVQTVENEMTALETRVSGFDLPIGSILLWGNNSSIPAKWIAMVGQDITNEAYAELRTAINKTSLPDTRWRVPQGDESPLGTIEAALPNIEGSIHGPAGTEAYGALTCQADSLIYSGGGAAMYLREGWTWLNASRSHSAYGNNTGINHLQPVQPRAFGVVFIIKYQ